MSLEKNKAIARQSTEEAWGKGNVAVIDELMAANFVLHARTPGVTPDREGYKEWVGMTRAAYPDGRITVEDTIAEGDKVVTRWSWRGTHTGEIWGIAPTGKQAAMTGMCIDRIVDGKIVEEWAEWDALGLMQQLGVVPPPGQH